MSNPNPNLHPRSVLHLDALSEATENWFLFSVSGSAPRTQDRARTWAAALAPDPTYQRLPTPLQALVVTGLRDAEATAMRAQLQAMAHELRAPRWHPSISKIALPPEDTKPYPPQAFTIALETAHAQALEQVPAIIRESAAQFLMDTFDQLTDAGWKVDLDREPSRPEPTASIERHRGDYVFVLRRGTDQTLAVASGHHGQLALEFTGALTDQDLTFLHLATDAPPPPPAPPPAPSKAVKAAALPSFPVPGVPLVAGPPALLVCTP